MRDSTLKTSWATLNRYSPILIIALAGGLIWLKHIGSSFLSACVQLSSAQGAITPAFERCLSSAHKVMWAVDVGIIFSFAWLIFIVVNKRCLWWLKIAACMAWLMAAWVALSPD